jgi:hypothetical protein
MTITRAVLLFFIAILIADYRFGNGRLIEAVSAQTAEVGYRLSGALSRLEHRIAPH